MWIGNVDFLEEVVHGPEMVHWLTAVHHDYEGTLAPNEVYKELEEGVDCESFVEVAYWVGVESRFDGYQAYPGGDGVDGHHEEDADDISLKQRLAVVLAIEGISFVSSLSYQRVFTFEAIST